MLLRLSNTVKLCKVISICSVGKPLEICKTMPKHIRKCNMLENWKLVTLPGTKFVDWEMNQQIISTVKTWQ